MSHRQTPPERGWWILHCQCGFYHRCFSKYQASEFAAVHSETCDREIWVNLVAR